MNILKELALMNRAKQELNKQIKEIDEQMSKLVPSAVRSLQDLPENTYVDIEDDTYVMLADDIKAKFTESLDDDLVFSKVVKTDLGEKVKRTIHASTLKSYIQARARDAQVDVYDIESVLDVQDPAIRQFLSISYEPRLVFNMPKYNSTANKERLYNDQCGMCAGCQEYFKIRNFTIDHIHPRSLGGSDHVSNLQLLCGACNSVKGTRSQEEFKQSLVDEGIIDKI